MVCLVASVACGADGARLGSGEPTRPSERDAGAQPVGMPDVSNGDGPVPSSMDAAGAATDIGNEGATLEAAATPVDATVPETDAAGDDTDATGVSDAGAASAVTAVAVGSTSTCAVTVAGQLVCLGMFQYDPNGSLAACPAAQDCSAPQVLAGLPTGVTSVAAGYKSTCAVLTDGRVACWGEAASGIAPAGSTAAVIIPNLSGVTSLSVGSGPLSPIANSGASACAVVTGGEVECWGGGYVVNSTATPVPIAGLTSGVTAVSVGTAGACAITAGGGVTCWGKGEFVRPTSPVQVADSSIGATALSVGTEAACLVGAGGNVMCWGSNGHGQLGAPLPASSNVPVQVPGLTGGFKSVVVGDSVACAVPSGGDVVCWGVGPFQDPAGITVVGPGPVPGLPSPVTSLAVGYGALGFAGGGPDTGCAIAGGGLYCWGGNHTAQITGDPMSAQVIAVPQRVTGF